MFLISGVGSFLSRMRFHQNEGWIHSEIEDPQPLAAIRNARSRSSALAQITPIQYVLGTAESICMKDCAAIMHWPYQ